MGLELCDASLALTQLQEATSKEPASMFHPRVVASLPVTESPITEITLDVVRVTWHGN